MQSLNPIEVDRIRDLAKSGQTKAAAEALNVMQSASGSTIEVQQLGAEVTALAGNHRGALEILGKLNRRDPKNNRTLRLAGRSFEAVGDFANARRAFYEAAQADPSDDYSLAHAANMFEQTNEFATALALVDRLARRNPSAAQRQELALMRASCLFHLGRIEESETQIDGFLKAKPEDARGITLKGRIELHRGNRDLARQHFQSALATAPEKDTPQLRGLIAYLDGAVDQGLDAAAVAKLFDRYANKFERHLVDELQYVAPSKIAARVAAHFGERAFALLDLGCGTGLVAQALQGTRGYTVGVDISEKMLNEAAKKKLYQQLHNVDVRDALRDTKSASFDLVVAADVFNYLGKLGEIAKDAFRILRDDGLFCFTIELDHANPDSEGTAANNMRILHGEQSTRNALEVAGFADISIEHFDMRVEAGEPVRAAICVGRKVAAAG
jgi:predicted TPR repeat methyltransferase